MEKEKILDFQIHFSSLENKLLNNLPREVDERLNEMFLF